MSRPTTRRDAVRHPQTFVLWETLQSVLRNEEAWAIIDAALDEVSFRREIIALIIDKAHAEALLEDAERDLAALDIADPGWDR